MSAEDEAFPRLRALRRKSLAERLQVSERTLDRWAADGEGPPGRFKIGSLIFYEAAAAEEWLQRRAEVQHAA